MIIDNTPLRPDDEPRHEVTLSLPRSVIDLLTQAQQDLGIAASDLVAEWVPGEASAALERRDDALSRMNFRHIAGWDALGFPVLKKE